jgi:3-oxoacyl-[acyl-carrier protein] reductase
MDLKLNGRVAIVTGASYGIGKGIARGFAEEGVKLSICARGEEKLRRVTGELEGMGAEVLPVVADVLNTEDIDRMVEQTLERYGHVDILVNNAGGMVRGTFAEASDEDWAHGMGLNLFSYIRFCRKVVPSMREKRWGRIINISSTWGHQPGVTPVYNTSKAGVIAMSKSLSNELAPDNILVNCVCPGGIITPAWVDTAEILARKRGTTWQDEIKKLADEWTVLGRFGEVEEVTDLVVFLASERASYITGACINIDGGNTRSIL